MEVLDVSLEVLGEAVDALGEQRYLHFGGTRVLAGALVLLDHLRLLRDLQCHSTVSLSRFASIFRAGDFNRCTAASQGFSMFISRLSEPEGAQLAFRMRTPETDKRTVSSVERAHAGAQSTDFQRLTVAQPRFGGGVELGGRKIGEQFAQAQQAHPGRWQSAQLLECHRVLHAKAAGAGAAQRRQMSASAERCADVLAKRADVCPFAATDAQLGERRLVAEQLELGDPHRARGALYAAAFARQRVQGYTESMRRDRRSPRSTDTSYSKRSSGVV